MEKLFGLMLLLSVFLLVVGVFSPQKSLFWLPTTPTRFKSSVLYLGLSMVFFLLFGLALEVSTELEEVTPTVQVQ
ncbi:hypothetical protein GCM10023185_39780 [Hymenobacter saemangeumensis]|uniref:Uncharacterized protein n=1 Tax=Hymenobacter saemangeumensis TaxID=1084522 RepID=A0ABP8IQV7_9BACT